MKDTYEAMTAESPNRWQLEREAWINEKTEEARQAGLEVRRGYAAHKARVGVHYSTYYDRKRS